MATVTVHAAKTHLSRLIQRVEAGEEIVIVRGKTPVARLTGIPPQTVNRRFGAYRGEFEVPDSFFEALPEEELAAFEGEGHDADPLRHSRTSVVDERRSAHVGKGARGRRRAKR